MTNDVRLEWGHPIKTPFGVEIRLPQKAFVRLRLLGLIEKAPGVPQISHRVFEFMDAEYDGFMGGLRQMLGAEFEGPEWVQCSCRHCRRKHEDADRTPLPRQVLRQGWMRSMDIVRARARQIGAKSA
jgi:hypothetical protein